MLDHPNEDRSISLDAYDSLVFKGGSAQYIAEVIALVKKLSVEGDIYPPSFATSREPVIEYGLRSQPDSENSGRLTEAEAVAIKALADENSGLSQSLGKGSKTNRKIMEALGEKNLWIFDVVDGMASFGYRLRGALSVRDKILRGESVSSGSSINNKLEQLNLSLFEKGLRMDGMALRNNTVSAACDVAIGYAKDEITQSPEGARNLDEINSRIHSRTVGINLGSKIFTQVFQLAEQRGLPTKLVPKDATSQTPLKLLK
jgi:hypothetical protein